ncbi:MAG: cytidylate kinase family protein, partial [Pseudomonadota bacterium]
STWRDNMDVKVEVELGSSPTEVDKEDMSASAKYLTNNKNSVAVYVPQGIGDVGEKLKCLCDQEKFCQSFTNVPKTQNTSCVIDREILEHLTSRNHLDKKLEAFIDERCPSEIEDILATLFGERSFSQSEYSRLLFRIIFSVADIGPAIFVGRGAHLILPRDRVFAVRLICSNEFRIKRLVNMLKIPESAASIKIHHYDMDQKNFFRRVYNLESAPANEFDLVINRDYIQGAKSIAEIVETAFKEKFGSEYIRTE